MESGSLSFNAGGYSHVWISIKNISSYISQRGKSCIIIVIIFCYISFVHVELIELNNFNACLSANK